MRLPFPERLSLFPVFAFCTTLFVLQQMEGTTLLFSTGTAIFILIATIAFNTAGGLTRPSGGFIFAYAILVAIFGIVFKVGLGEPGQSNLMQPNLTIAVYIGTIAAMLFAVYFSHRFTRKKSLFPQFKTDADMGRAAIGCLFVGAAAMIYPFFATSGGGSGSLFSAVQQLNNFLALAIILGTTYEIRKSGGRRSVNTSVLVAGFFIFAGGIMDYSKQGLLEPFVAWLFAAAAQRYKVSLVQITGLFLWAAFFSYYLVPYAQYGRNFREGGQPFSEIIKTNLVLLSNLNKIRAIGTLDEENLQQSEDLIIHYFNKPEGFADRLQMIGPDDSLIDTTEKRGAFGIFPTLFAFENLIPHFIWPGKPILNFGNMYAHEVGIITDDTDTTTGISFSPSGEAYHQAKWVGIFVLLPGLLFFLFILTDSCCGDTRYSPFALLALTLFLHGAPESGVIGIIGGLSVGIVSLFLASLLTVKLMPVIADLIVGPVQHQTETPPLIESKHRHFSTASTVPGSQYTEAPTSAYRWSGRKPGE